MWFKWSYAINSKQKIIWLNSVICNNNYKEILRASGRVGQISSYWLSELYTDDVFVKRFALGKYVLCKCVLNSFNSVLLSVVCDVMGFCLFNIKQLHNITQIHQHNNATNKMTNNIIPKTIIVVEWL